jgi:hypothetical protein
MNDDELETIKSADELELENTIRQLIARKDAARDGSAPCRVSMVSDVSGETGTMYLHV